MEPETPETPAEPQGVPLAELVPAAAQANAIELGESELEVRDLDKREIFVRLARWGDQADTPAGVEEILPGAFQGVDPKSVVLRLGHEGDPAGRGMGAAIEEREDGAYMVLRASKTARGDEALTLAKDGVTRYTSVEYDPRSTRANFETRAGRRVIAISKMALRAVALTWKPYYAQTAVLEVRAEPEKPKEIPVGDTANTPAAEPAAQPQADVINSAIMARLDAMHSSIEEIQERSRGQFAIPGAGALQGAKAGKITKGQWMEGVLKMLSGDRLPEYQMRDLADLIVADNVGVVPDAISSEIIGPIEESRPFLETTRKMETPATGMTMTVPKIVTRPTVGVQVAEKDELTSTPTAIDTVDYSAVTKGGAGDISLQLLKRSSPSFLSLYLELLAEAYAADSDQEAVEALLDEGVSDGGTLDPEDVSFGTAWENSMANRKRRPDRLWLSSHGVSKFIDAKANGTNQPLYSNLDAAFTAGDGPGGTISGMRPVWVPALDNVAGVDAIAGPSSGFAWAEDGTFTLQVDVPARAGRDVALVGILWFAPMYPLAFTKYDIS
jgi:phage head maturation protease